MYLFWIVGGTGAGLVEQTPSERRVHPFSGGPASEFGSVGARRNPFLVGEIRI